MEDTNYPIHNYCFKHGTEREGDDILRMIIPSVATRLTILEAA